MTGVHRPAYLDRVAGLEELGATALRVGEQRFYERPSGSGDLVHGDVAHVEELRDRAAVMIVGRAFRRGRVNADLLGTYRDRSGAPIDQPGVGRHAHRPEAFHVDRDNPVRTAPDRAGEKVAVPD